MNFGKMAGLALAGACAFVGVAWADDISDATFSMPQDVVAAATAFESYMDAAARIDSGFSSGETVHRGLQAAASYEPAQLEEGMIAYGAIAALQDDRFVAGVEAAAGQGAQREAFAEQLVEDPYAATRIDGAGGAVRRMDLALAAKARLLVSAGVGVKQSAYTVQHQAWSKVMVAEAQDRLAEVKTLSHQRAQPSLDDSQAMMQRVAGVDPGVGDGPDGFNAIEARALALAAESVIGRAQAADRDRLSPLLSEADSAECFKMSKLNFYQCMAVAGPQYEDIFCMGQHAMMDTGQCVGHAAHDSGGSGDASLALVSRPDADRAVAVPMVAHRLLRIDPN